jgi:hypothetical protein
MAQTHRRNIKRKAGEAGAAKTEQAPIPETGGRELSTADRARLEPKLGADLSSVRIHTSGESSRAATGLNARAFTVGNDIHFNSGEFAPGTREGDRLLAHELTHVVQGAKSGAQRKARSDDEERDEVSQPGDPAELEADHVADTVVGQLHDGGARAAAPAAQRVAAQPIQRKPEPGGDGDDSSKLTDEERWKKIEEFLKGSETGQQALKLKDKHKIQVKWQKGGGSYYDMAGTMVLDTSRPTERVALAFVHEMNHAKYDKEGLAADQHVTTMDRASYVEAQLKEETEGTCLSIEAKIELEMKGQKVSVSYPLEEEYREAYEKAGGSLKPPAGKGKGEAKLDAGGKAKAREAVLKGFKDGKVVGSKSNKPYPDVYGEAWDKANPGKK